ncbi:MAG: cysteine desulfurase family protein [bacterium]
MSLLRKKRIYLDYAAATPLLPEVKRAMDKYWSQDFHNPSSVYQEGTKVRQKVEDYRRQLATILGVSKKDIFFTSGGTESNNLALLGVFKEALMPSDNTLPILRPHIVISDLEHSSVRETAMEIVRLGGEVSILRGNENGFISLEAVEKLLRPNTILVSITLASNITGTLEPISKIGRIVQEKRRKNGDKYPYLHTDASQASNYIDINLQKLKADLLTVDSSKVYGPRGVGLLALTPNVSLRPIIFGGGQERGLRSGTENTALIAGFVTALEIAKRDREVELKRLEELKNFFLDELKRSLPQVTVISATKNTLPSIVSVLLPTGALNELVLLDLDRNGIAVSTGSACDSLGEIENESLLRFSFGRGTTKGDLRQVLKVFARILKHDKPPHLL